MCLWSRGVEHQVIASLIPRQFFHCTVDVFAKEVTPILKLVRSKILTVFEDVADAGAFMAKAAIQRIREPDSPPAQMMVVPEGPA